MNKYRIPISLLVLTPLVSIGLIGLPPAAANSGASPLGVEQAIETVIAHDMSISGSAVALLPGVTESGGAAFAAAANDVEVTLPVDLDEAVTLVQNTTVAAEDDLGEPEESDDPSDTPEEGPLEEPELHVLLPSGGTADPAYITNDGALGYDNNDGSYTVPIAGEDGDLQINTVIEHNNAPKRYDYTFDFPQGATAHEINGALVFLDTEENLLLLMAPPWATDASGDPVSTWYEVDGDTVTQVVDHGGRIEYPVVADPWMSIRLFKNFSNHKRWNNDYVYSGTVTNKARLLFMGVTPPNNPVVAAQGHALWVMVMKKHGWAEWTKKYPKITNKATLRQQFNCHVAAGVWGLPFTGSYDLERARPNRTDGNWLSGVESHQCNWSKATGGDRS